MPGESMAHDCMVFVEPPECLVGVEASTINKMATMVEDTVVSFVPKHTGASVMGHNTADT